MDILRLEKFLKEKGEPDFRLKQIHKGIFKDAVSSFMEISTISKELRKELSKEFAILPFKSSKVLVSQDQKAIKALLELADGERIETVLLSPKPGTWSACISSQVGCALRCAFCATGKAGFVRNLSTEEITGQVLFWKQYLQENALVGQFSNIVYMGMGEPFLNWENVKKSLEILIDEKLFDFSRRNIAVSTAGIVEGMEKFTKAFPQVNLALSLHFADNNKREQYMPVNRRDNLNDLKQFLQNYFKVSTRKVFFEYILLAGINDGKQDAQALIQFLKSIGKMQLLHVNLIRYNSVDNELVSSSREVAQRFQDQLKSAGVHCTIRKSMGEDIQGACGQLAGKSKKQ